MTGPALILGGARSGKSRYGEGLVRALPGAPHYLATAQALDAEMAARIASHRLGRAGQGWVTVEAPLDLTGALARVPAGAPVLIDCLTLWLTNQLMAGQDLEAESAHLAAALAAHPGPLAAVANEVGLGLVPETAMGRQFRDAAGRLHQRIAARAGLVVLMVAGLPLTVKGDPEGWGRGAG